VRKFTYYDQYNDLISIEDWLFNTTEYYYDPAGQLVEMVLPNGDTTVYDYDEAGRLIFQRSETAIGQKICEYSIELDEVGNRIAIEYDQPLLPIPPAEDEIIEYTYDDADRLLTVNDADYVFSNRGNLIQKTEGSETTDYTYDSHDWLTEIATLAEQWLNDYDAQGQRLEETSLIQTKRFTIDPTIGDMWNVVAETDETNTPQFYYIYGNGLVYLIDASTDEPLYYHYDPIGSTVALTDISGSVIDSYSYEEFGKLLASSNIIANRYKYVGKYGVSSAPDSLLYMRARYYDKSSGRFISADPISPNIKNPLDMHKYLYAAMNPLINKDPSGKYWESENGAYLIREDISTTAQLLLKKTGW
jgi:RHS repeat-associated protein